MYLYDDMRGANYHIPFNGGLGLCLRYSLTRWGSVLQLFIIKSYMQKELIQPQSTFNKIIKTTKDGEL